MDSEKQEPLSTKGDPTVVKTTPEIVEAKVKDELPPVKPQVENIHQAPENTKVEIANQEDDTLIDFSKITSSIKKLFKQEKKDLGLDKPEEIPKKAKIELSQIKEKTVNFFKGKSEDNVDFRKVVTSAKKNANWLIPVLFILIAILTSTHFRMMASDLPITEDWATNTVNNFYTNQLQNQINQDYPRLPQANRDALIQTELEKFLEENKEQVQRDISQLTEQYKSNFQDANGDTYLLAIDPYLWYSQTRNVVNHGHLGDTKIDGESYFSLRDGRLPKKSSPQLHPYLAAGLYKVLKIFNGNISIMRAVFLMPVFIIALSMIPIFFIGRRISGNVAGLFAALFLAVNAPLLGRTSGGFADTDAYNILIPLLVAWLFLEAYHMKKQKHQIMLTILAGLGVSLYSLTWSGWSYIFLFVIGSVVMSAVLKNGLNHLQKAKLELRNHLTLLLTFIGSSALFISIFRHPLYFWYTSVIRPLRFITLKDVGIKSIWPNVLTTVAEFNTTSFTNIIGQMGGNLLFFIAVSGILLTIIQTKKKDFLAASLLVLWFLGAGYAFTKGVRFAILITPAFALALGSAFGFIYEKVSVLLSKSVSINKNISRVVIFACLCLFLITPFSTAKSVGFNEVPSMNDAWFDALTKIKDDGSDGIITSWWDFGHWFSAISERRVTFDGGDQGQRIHWVGRSLQTANENEAIGILRMLNCAQETAPAKLDEFTGDNLASVKLIKEAILLDRPEALRKYQESLTAEQAQIMIEFTHCQDLIPNYFITSHDMVGKSGVWGHFGSWDFERASMYQNTNKLPRAKAISYLKENFGLTEEQADRIHGEIQSTKGDQWIAPWPSYLSSVQSCQRTSETELICVGSVQGGNVGINVNLETLEVGFQGTEAKPNSLLLITETETIIQEQEGEKTGFSIALIPNGDSYLFFLADPLQIGSMFSRMFFMEGHGLKCFSKFDDRQQTGGGRIITWKVDYECKQNNNVYFQEN